MIPQRNPKSARILSVRPLETSDLELLRSKSLVPRLQKIRDSHHVVARLLASGLSTSEAAARVGYTATRISVLRSDPAFEDLVAKYRDTDTEAWLKSRDDYYEVATSNMLKAERMIADRIDDAIDSAEPLPLRDLLTLTSDRADRFGYGKRSTQTNINVDFAGKLEAARRRIDQAKLIDAEVQP